MFLRSLLTGLLKREVQKRASQTAAEAVRRAGEETVTAATAAQDPSATECDIAVLMALDIEAGGLLDRMQSTVKTRGAGFTAYSGSLAQRRVVVAVTGPGGEAALHATGALIDGHSPKWLISAGFAGSLHADLGRGDLLVANRILSPDGRRLTIDFKMSETAGLHVAALLTVDHIVHTPEEKRNLGQQYEARAVDMETMAVAQHCRQAKQRFLAVRVISDALDDHLPSDIEHLMQQKTKAGQAGAVAGALFRRPTSVKDMWRLKQDAITASDRLASLLVRLLPRLT